MWRNILNASRYFMCAPSLIFLCLEKAEIVTQTFISAD